MTAIVKIPAVIILTILLVAGISTATVVRSNVSRFTDSADEVLLEILKFDGQIDVSAPRSIPINLDIPLKDILDINTLFSKKISIRQTIPINQTIKIDETIKVPISIPMIGTQQVDVPLNTSIPINMSVPVSFDIDPKQFISIPANQTVKIRQNIPLPKIGTSINVGTGSFSIKETVGKVHTLVNSLRRLFFIPTKKLI